MTLKQKLELAIKRYENEDADVIAKDTANSVLEDMLAMLPDINHYGCINTPHCTKCEMDKLKIALTAYCIGEGTDGDNAL